MHGTNDGTRHIKGYGIESLIAFSCGFSLVYLLGLFCVFRGEFIVLCSDGTFIA